MSFAKTASGEICGAITALSLSQLPVPASLHQYCLGGRSMLDVIVGGCHYLGYDVVNATRPDTFSPPGASYQLIVTNNVVTSCQDPSGASVPLATCLSNAAFSASLAATADRVILK